MVGKLQCEFENPLQVRSKKAELGLLARVAPGLSRQRLGSFHSFDEAWRNLRGTIITAPPFTDVGRRIRLGRERLLFTLRNQLANLRRTELSMRSAAKVRELFRPKGHGLRRQIGFQIPVQYGRGTVQERDLAGAFEELSVRA